MDQAGLAGRTALVTGAASGIGKAVAMRLAADGAYIGVLDLDGPAALAVAESILCAGGRAVALCADVSDEGAMRTALDHLAAQTGQLNVIVANAGINGVWAPIDELTPAEWDRVVRINLRGTFMSLHLGVPFLKRAGGGAIVIVSSINGTRTFSLAGATAYAATKAAQRAMAEMLALELAKHAIRVNAVCPGSIDTGIAVHRRNADDAGEPVIFPDGSIPLTNGRAGKPDDVADLISFLVSRRASHITGTPVWIDGGESLLVG